MGKRRASNVPVAGVRRGKVEDETQTPYPTLPPRRQAGRTHFAARRARQTSSLRCLALTPSEAELYALTHRGNAGDAELYARVCSGAERVLELGCGYGRLLPVLAGRKRHVVGLELDPRLCSLARRTLRESPGSWAARVRVVKGDMSRFSFRERFDRIVIPHSGLYCLTSAAKLLGCLRHARRHLAPDGRVAFDAYAADAFHAESRSADLDAEHLTPVVSLVWRGKTWDVFEKSRWLRSAQRLFATYLYVPRSGGAPHAIQIAQRYLLTKQLPALLASAGLELTAFRWGLGEVTHRPAEHWFAEARLKRP
ncbi:MAG TPA: class I SAM-dependent methyltransferase [Polyangiaceae bacterium]|nr:class I SAM-dependent methyltransferase [Polyangiaceae bacterium]